MRTRPITQILSFAAIVTVGAIWVRSRVTAVDLQTRLAALTVHRNTSIALEQERDRLCSVLAEVTLHQKVDTKANSSTLVQPATAASYLPLGEWRSSREWRNEGRSTAQGTVATLLWAAAGGDLPATMELISFDEAGRKKAQAFFDTLPPAVRQAFSTPEALVTSLTIQAMPDNAAQLSWFHQRDADHATVGLLLGALDQTAPIEVSADSAKDNRPPMFVDNLATKLTVLSLQRSSTGWRVVIPAAAVERLAHLSKPPTN